MMNKNKFLITFETHRESNIMHQPSKTVIAKEPKATAAISNFTVNPTWFTASQASSIKNCHPERSEGSHLRVSRSKHRELSCFTRCPFSIKYAKRSQLSQPSHPHFVTKPSPIKGISTYEFELSNYCAAFIAAAITSFTAIPCESANFSQSPNSGFM